MGGEPCVEVTLAELDAERLIFVARVAANDDALAVRTPEDDGLDTFRQRMKGEQSAARLNEVGEVLVGVIFRGVAIAECGGVHLHEGVLFPTPGAAALIA